MRENKKETEDYLLSEELLRRMKVIHSRYNIPESFDDFFQDYRVAILSGKSAHQTLDQFAIDYIRKVLGRNGQRADFHNTIEIHDRDTPVTDKSSIDLNTILDSLKGSGRIAGHLYFRYSMNVGEIALLLGVTSGRVSQIIKSVCEVLNVQFDELS